MVSSTYVPTYKGILQIRSPGFSRQVFLQFKIIIINFCSMVHVVHITWYGTVQYGMVYSIFWGIVHGNIIINQKVTASSGDGGKWLSCEFFYQRFMKPAQNNFLTKLYNGKYLCTSLWTSLKLLGFKVPFWTPKWANLTDF